MKLTTVAAGFVAGSVNNVITHVSPPSQVDLLDPLVDDIYVTPTNPWDPWARERINYGNSE